MARVLSAMSVVTIVVASVLLASGDAYAHERRMVGPYQLVVGWLSEPAYVGQLNSLDLRVTDTRTNQPVSGLEKTLKAELSAGGLAPFSLAISARFGTAGAYNGWVMPTVAGQYTFHLSGAIETQHIDEKFQSGPNTFGDIEDTSTLQYPAKVPVADELARKLDAIQSTLDQTRIIAIGGLALGLIALGAAALLRRRTS